MSALLLSLSQQRKWSFCLAIPGSADEDERAFTEAFRLKPRFAASTGTSRRQACRILNNDFAVDDGGTAVKLGCCLDKARIAVRPVEAVARIGSCFAAFDNEEGAVSVVLNFMDPACARRWMIDCGCELRTDELQRHAKTI
jgi:hypothetical protein